LLRNFNLQFLKFVICEAERNGSYMGSALKHTHHGMLEST